MALIPGMAEKLRDEAEAHGIHHEARRVARKTLMFGKNWREDGGARITTSMKSAIESWERQTGKSWESVFGRNKA